MLGGAIGLNGPDMDLVTETGAGTLSTRTIWIVSRLGKVIGAQRNIVLHFFFIVRKRCEIA
jgi:hypothetical protein